MLSSLGVYTLNPDSTNLGEPHKWPRRFNGGTWWGFIQFFVVLLTFRFFLDWVPAWRSLRQAERENRTVDERRRLVRDRSQTLTLIVVLLPLIGFLGTVAGLSESLVTSAGVASDVPAERQSALTAMQIALGTAFDKSMLAFSAVIICTSFRHWLFSRAEY